jgi:hypothetical protein
MFANMPPGTSNHEVLQQRWHLSLVLLHQSKIFRKTGRRYAEIDFIFGMK